MRLLDPIELNLTVKKDVGVLKHYPIPSSLTGINPRNILGLIWWEKKRREVYRSNDYYCLACGEGDSALEAHETYEYNFNERVMTFKRAIPLCNGCHYYIHCLRNVLGYRKMEVLARMRMLANAGYKISEFKMRTYRIEEAFEVDTEWDSHLESIIWDSWKLSLGDLDLTDVNLASWEAYLEH